MNVAFVEARAALEPGLSASWTEVAGAYAMFDGAGSPLTQSFGLGLFDQVGSAEMQALESFFERRGAQVFHEISPLADSSLVCLLNERGYQPIEFTSVLFRPAAVAIDLSRPRDEPIVVRCINPGEEDLWARIAAEGWGETAELAAFVRKIGEVAARSKGSLCLLAESAGQPIASAALGFGDRVAILAGASTIPRARNRGAQRALLQARLQIAAERGCDLVMMGAQPGSTSRRNAERQDFRIAYSRIKWQLRRAGDFNAERPVNAERHCESTRRRCPIALKRTIVDSPLANGEHNDRSVGSNKTVGPSTVLTTRAGDSCARRSRRRGNPLAAVGPAARAGRVCDGWTDWDGSNTAGLCRPRD